MCANQTSRGTELHHKIEVLPVHGWTVSKSKDIREYHIAVPNSYPTGATTKSSLEQTRRITMISTTTMYHKHKKEKSTFS